MRGRHAAPSRMAALAAIVTAIVSSQPEKPKAEPRQESGTSERSS